MLILRDGAMPVFGAIEDAVGALAAVTVSATARHAPMPAAGIPIGATGYTACRKMFAASGIGFPAPRGAQRRAGLGRRR